ncbi:MAG: agmatinase [Bacteroidales bacterium]|nr:agmatinase [Bacteroidales bacterium]MDY6348430.1 agmatinase [Bacteroidales bacterium]
MVRKMDNFLDFDDESLYSLDSAEYVILGVPYDGTSTFVKGADRGPQAILDASDSLELYDIQYNHEAWKSGIHTDRHEYDLSSPEKMVRSVYDRVLHFTALGKRTILTGGEHSVSVGAIRAVAEKHSGLSVLQIDAHADLRDSYHGSPYNHACVMRRAQEVANVVQVGIRSVCSEELHNVVAENIFYAHNIHGSSDWMEKALGRLTENVYITVDLDGFDPSLLPATGTPQPGGLQWYPTLEFLGKVFSRRNVVAFDIVELCPQPGDKVSDVMAASLLYKMITLWDLNKNR